MVSVSRRRLASMLRGRGIEIGALHLPLAVPPGAEVTYVDRLPLDQLRVHYHELEAQNLAPVEVLGTAEDLSAFADASLDFVIANHLIEHTEDPIRALKEFHRVLRPRGLLFMCVPDARVTFDKHRQLTTVEHLLAEHRGGHESVEANRLHHYQEWVDDVENADVEGIWPHLDGPDRDARVELLVDMDYSIHFHCWNAESFLEFLRAACRAEAIGFEVLDWVDTVPNGQNELILLAAKQPSLTQKGRSRWLRFARHHAGWRETLRSSPAGPALVALRRVLSRRR